MAAESFGRVATGAPALKPLSFSVHPKVYDNLARRAAVLNIRPAEYARRLFEAAYAVRCAHEKGERHEDRELDGQVRLVFLMADCEGEFIAEALGLRDATVARILDGWRIVGGEIERPVAAVPPPAPSAPAPSVSEAPRKDPRSSAAYPPEMVETIRAMWAQGRTGKDIAAAIGKAEGALSMWMSKNRDVCPKRQR